MNWFSKYGRRFPWRETRDWYRTLVAELMLIRTRSETVETVYREFLERFPQAENLCNANPKDIEPFFKRLGLVQRAQRLHKAVCTILEKYGGTIPCSIEELFQLPGVGNYIARVLMTRVCKEPVPFVDTNILRVTRRFLGNPNIGADHAERWLLSSVPRHLLENVNIALLDLAALVCKPKRSRCDICPLTTWCRTGSRANIP